MGGSGGNQQEKERERTTWLAEDEDVWGTDPDTMPAVIGREDEVVTASGSGGRLGLPDRSGSDKSARPGQGTVRSRG
jgi:hypothetical protein